MISRHIAAYTFLFTLVVVLVLLAASPSFAAGMPTANCDSYAGLTNKIAGCIRDSLDKGVTLYFSKFYPMLQTAIGAVMTLAVIVYGILLSYSMVEKVGRDTLILLFKIAGIVYFTTNSGFIYTSTISVMDDLATAVISYAPQSGSADAAKSDFTQATCLQTMIDQQQKAGGKGKIAGPWLGMDCLIDTVIGIKIPSDTEVAGSPKTYFNKLLDPKMEGMSRGFLYLFFSGAQTSTMGMVMAAIGAIFIWGLIALIIKTLFIYIAGYMGIAFMTVISPLFIPMILFQHTRTYFDKWLKSFFSFALQPVIMMAFVTFSIAAIDFAAFSSDYSIWYRIAGKESRNSNGFNLNTYLTTLRKADGSPATAADKDAKAIILPMKESLLQVLTNNPTPKTSAVVSVDQGGALSGTERVDCTKDKIAADQTGALKKYCAFNYSISVDISFLDWKLMAKARQDPLIDGATDEEKGKNIANEVLSSIAFCAMVVFLMNGFLKIIPLVAYDITGDFNQSANLGQIVAGRWKDKEVLGDLAKLIPGMVSGGRK